MTLSLNFSHLSTCITCFRIWKRVAWQLTELQSYKTNTLPFLPRSCDLINLCCKLNTVLSTLEMDSLSKIIVSYVTGMLMEVICAMILNCGTLWQTALKLSWELYFLMETLKLRIKYFPILCL